MNSIASFVSPRLWMGWRAGFRNGADVEAAGLALLGVIPEFLQSQSSTHPRDEFAGVWDAYKAAGAGLRASLGDGKVIAVTSALPEEGKSTTSANLATALARQGNRVVLVDANLRWPSLRHSGEDPAPGLSELLRNPALEPLHALRRTSERGLFLLPGGEPSSDPGPLLRSPRLAVVLAELQVAAEFVILDGPPVSEGAGAGILAKSADATVVVIQARKSRRRALTKALQQLSKAGVSPAGAMLNRSGYASAIPVEPREKRPLTAVWAEAPLLGLIPAEDALVAAFGAAEPVADATTPQSVPRLRLLQPYERPLLPFGEKAAPVLGTRRPVREEDSLEITVDELLVDLEKTLTLIRDLKGRHASAQDV